MAPPPPTPVGPRASVFVPASPVRQAPVARVAWAHTADWAGLARRGLGWARAGLSAAAVAAVWGLATLWNCAWLWFWTELWQATVRDARKAGFSTLGDQLTVLLCLAMLIPTFFLPLAGAWVAHAKRRPAVSGYAMVSIFSWVGLVVELCLPCGERRKPG